MSKLFFFEDPKGVARFNYSETFNNRGKIHNKSKIHRYYSQLISLLIRKGVRRGYIAIMYTERK